MSGQQGLLPLGWDDRVAERVGEVATADGVPARVVRVDLDSCVLATGDNRDGEERARTRIPVAVGDWVVARSGDGLRGTGSGDGADILAVAPRSSEIARRDPSGLTQVLAANVDLVLVTAPADRLSPARVEREIAIAWDGGAQPVVLLTKCDLDTEGLAEQLRTRLAGVDVIPVSATTGSGTPEIARLLQPARTAVLLGPSGAGKSSLTNRLLGRDVLTTGQVREGDHRGRHVTSARQMFVVPTGGVLIDTPGLRSLSLAADHGGVTAAFPDIEALAVGCRYRDCTHEHEPDCAVLAAERDGTLGGNRLANYRKLRRELDFALRRDDPAAARENRLMWKARSKAARRLNRERGH